MNEMRCPFLRCLTSLVMGLASICPVSASHPKCDRCGCESHCQRICRLESSEKEVTTTQWGVACEEFCIPGPSLPICKNCETICDETADEKSPVSLPKRLRWTQWGPGAHACVKSRAKLMKRTVTKKVPCYKWVTEDLCDGCRKSVNQKDKSLDK
jgi:hypothetical protein